MSPPSTLWIVVLSVAVAVQGSYAGLHFARQIVDAQGRRPRQLIAASALSLALAVWTMHFLGMLALDLPHPADFLVLPTLISFLLCVLLTGTAVFIVGRINPSQGRIAAAALLMGGGIVTMHYVGMSALHASVRMAYNPVSVAASAVIGVAASGLALWLGFRRAIPRSIAGSAVIMGLAISAMHYVAMMGTRLSPHHDMTPGGTAPGQEPAVSTAVLALLVTAVAFGVSGLFLLTLVPVPDERFAPDEQAQPSLRAPPDLPPAAPEPVADAAAPSYAMTLPIEREGVRRLLEVSQLIAVQAQAHYTHLFDGKTAWFCPLTISEVEARLDPGLFFRIHRSHIVKLDGVLTIKRSGDAALVAMATLVEYHAPVARSRQTALRDRLATRLDRSA